MPGILSAERVTKEFLAGSGQGLIAVQDLSLEIEEGEFLCLIGASGCGKSTLLNMFAGFIQPTLGEVLLRGAPITRIEPRCGMVFQSYALFPWKTVRGNVEFGPKMKGLPAAERHRIADRFIELVKLRGFEDRYPTELSGGMQQRVTLARVLAADPEVLLMDEPFAALDEITRGRLNDDLLALFARQKLTVIFVTHSVYESVYLSTRIVVISARPGRVTADIPIEVGYPRTEDFRTSAIYNERCRLVSAALRRAMGPDGEPT
jgi:NitT/TauT family transport system ATP-binding protein